MSALVFFGFFALYLFTAAPHLAPYRDAGEMASLLSTFGVAHPPGYPLYTLIGRLIVQVPLGNIVYRANAFSALCAAGALALLFAVLRRRLNLAGALVAVIAFGLSNPFWDLATVSEMYTLGILWFCLLFYAAFTLDNKLLFAFLMALGLGVRMDMLLLVPLFLIWFWLNGARREFSWMAVFFTAGASVFLYLTVRSNSNPLIDWGNPDTLLAAFNSARRKSYSGTLDLLSLSYRPGENFGVNLILYAKHLFQSFGWAIILSVAGVIGALKVDRRFGLFILTVFGVTGPVFLYLANMPPNPHAVAIVEASYLLPDLMIAVLVGFGVYFVEKTFENNPNARQVRFGLLAGGVLLVGLNSLNGYVRASKRHNLYARDYVENVLRSLPKGAIGVFHKDVQLFSLWAAQLVDHRRPDLSLVSTGLSGSPWYWDMRKRWSTAPTPDVSLKEPGGWQRLKQAAADRPLLAGYDVELNDVTGLQPKPQGVLMSFTEANPGRSVALLHDLGLYRGEYHYGETPDFFSTDLIGDLARAHHQQAFALMMGGQQDGADWFFARAESLDPTFARASSDRGYLAYTRGKINEAYNLYGAAASKAEKTLELTAVYKSLPLVVDGCRVEASNIYTQWGAMAERIGRMEEARNIYVRSLGIRETAQAHYNLAVTYWGRDWQQVVSHMRRAIELNPQMSDAHAYLAKAQAMMGARQ